MAIVRIPIDFRAALQELKDLPDEVVDRIQDLLESLEGFPELERLAADIRDVAVDIGRPIDAETLLRALVSLRAQAPPQAEPGGEGAEIGRLANDLAASPDLGIADLDERAGFARRVSALLVLDSVGMIAAAQDVLGESERIFESARIMTDIRPIFGPNAAQKPAAAIIVNTLKIASFTVDGEEELYVALDESDLEMLKKAVERAMTKTETIRTFLRESGLTEFRSDA